MLSSISRATSWLTRLSSTSSTDAARSRRRGGARRADARARRGAGGRITSASPSYSSDWRTGLVRCAPMPAARSCAPSPATPSEVSSSSRVAAIAGSARIARASARPSMPGICMSRIAASYGVPSRAAVAQRGERGGAVRSRAGAHLPATARGAGGSRDWSRCRRRRARAARRARSPAPRRRSRFGVALRAAERHREEEARAAARLALDADLAAHQVDELLRDREAEAGAAEAARGRAVGLRERLEEPRLRLARRCRCRCRAPRSAPACRRRRRSASVTATTTSPASVNLMALPTRLIEHLAQPARVAAHGGGHVVGDAAGELEALAMRAFGEQLGDVFDHLGAGRSRSLRGAACRPRSSRSRGCR